MNGHILTRVGGGVGVRGKIADTWFMDGPKDLLFCLQKKTSTFFCLFLLLFFYPFMYPFFILQIYYRSCLLYYPPPSNSKKTFSDGYRWFEFEWGILRAELQTQFYLVKSRKPKEILGFSKKFQTGLGVLSSRGGGNKVDENGKCNRKNIFRLEFYQ